jgi:hypothetical protein
MTTASTPAATANAPTANVNATANAAGSGRPNKSGTAPPGSEHEQQSEPATAAAPCAHSATVKAESRCTIGFRSPTAATPRSATSSRSAVDTIRSSNINLLGSTLRHPRQLLRSLTRLTLSRLARVSAKRRREFMRPFLRRVSGIRARFSRRKQPKRTRLANCWLKGREWEVAEPGQAALPPSSWRLGAQKGCRTPRRRLAPQ